MMYNAILFIVTAIAGVTASPVFAYMLATSILIITGQPIQMLDDATAHGIGILCLISIPALFVLMGLLLAKR